MLAFAWGVYQQCARTDLQLGSQLLAVCGMCHHSQELMEVNPPPMTTKVSCVGVSLTCLQALLRDVHDLQTLAPTHEGCTARHPMPAFSIHVTHPSRLS